MSGLQRIRLKQIYGNVDGFNNFEEQLDSMRSIHEDRFEVAEGQKTITLTKEYNLGYNQLLVFVNGMRASLNDDYTETNSRMITFKEELEHGDVVIVRIGGEILFRNNNTKAITSIEILRQSFIITTENQGQIEFVTDREFTLNANSLEVYRDGMLLEVGGSKDYLELDTKTFRLNYSVPTGTVITAKIFKW